MLFVVKIINILKPNFCVFYDYFANFILYSAKSLYQINSLNILIFVKSNKTLMPNFTLIVTTYCLIFFF